MKRTPAPRTRSREFGGAAGGSGFAGRTDASPSAARTTMRRTFARVSRPRARTGKWMRAKWRMAERPRTASATIPTWIGFGPKNDSTLNGAMSSRRDTPSPSAPSDVAAMCAPHDSQPLRNPAGEGSALRTHTYVPPEASGRPDASSAYDIPASITTSAAIARLTRTNGPATVYVAPTSRKIAAPTIDPTAAIVTSKSPRSRVTRTRTEPAPGPREATGGGESRGYLSLWRARPR